jgi:hypothetical protein
MISLFYVRMLNVQGNDDKHLRHRAEWPKTTDRRIGNENFQ